MRRWICGVGLLLASPSFAQEENPEERAKAMFEEGGRLYEAGQYEEAVQAFQIAYSLSPKPLLLYNMVAPLERLGRWDEALEALTTYAETAPEDEQDSLQSRITSLRIRISDRDNASAAPAPEPEPEPAVVATVEPEKRGNPLAVALFGVGAAGAGVGGVFTATALGARGQWRSSCVDAAGEVLCPEDAQSAWKRDNAHSLVADIGWVVGLAGVGGGVAVTFGGGASDVTLQVAPTGLRVGGRW